MVTPWLLALEVEARATEVAAMVRLPAGATAAWIEALAVPGVHAAVISPENEALAMSGLSAELNAEVAAMQHKRRP